MADNESASCGAQDRCEKEVSFSYYTTEDLILGVREPQAIIQVVLSTSSPTLCLTDDDTTNPFYIITTATIKSSKSLEKPINLNNDAYPRSVTAMASAIPGDRADLASPAVRGNAIADLTEKTTPKKKVSWRVTRPHIRQGPPTNLSDYAQRTFITVPVSGSVSVKHLYPRTKSMESNVLPGEVYTVAFNPPGTPGVGMLWWTWGDLETDLPGKKFGYEGRKGGIGGTVTEGPEWAVDKTRWPSTLAFEHYGSAEIQIV